MSLEIKEVEGNAQSLVQQEQDLIAEKEAQDTAAAEAAAAAAAAAEAAAESSGTADTDTLPEIDEDEVLSFMNERFGTENESLDLFAKTEQEELTGDVAVFAKYNKETGRGFNDFMKSQTNTGDVSEDKLLRDYLSSTNEGLDDEDIALELAQFDYDKDLDDDKDIRKAKLDKKKLVIKARKYFDDENEKYKLPTESVGKKSIDSDDLELFEKYKQDQIDLVSSNETNEGNRKLFMERTGNLFNDDFKGFEVKLNEDTILFSPGETKDVLKNQSDIGGFINKFRDKDGNLTDVKGYHRALSIAMNPDKFAEAIFNHAYAEGQKNHKAEINNINMSDRKPVVKNLKNGVTITTASETKNTGKMKLTDY